VPIPLPPAGPGWHPAFDLSPAARAYDGSRAVLAAALAIDPPAPVEEPGSGALLRFKSMMNAEGLVCDLARLCDDRLYAYERIAQAHATANEGLRRMALELFQIYHRREAAAAERQ